MLFAPLLLSLALAQTKATSPCASALDALVGPKPEGRQQAALSLLEQCGRDGPWRNDERAAAGLRAAASEGSAAAIVLLGYLPGTVTAPPAGKRVKLKPWSAPVASEVAVAVAQARQGDATALTAAAGTTEPATSIFLLEVLSDIDAPAALKVLASKLEDRREITGGVPSHVQPRRRVADLALERFAARLTLKLSFALTPSRRYTNAQLAEAQRAVNKALMKQP